MTLDEFNQLIAEQRNNGLTDEDIFKVFAGMFVDGDLEREPLIAIGKHLGFEITEEASKMSDDELRDAIFEKSENEVEEGVDPDADKVDPDGDPAPRASKSEDEEGHGKGEPEKGSSEPEKGEPAPEQPAEQPAEKPSEEEEASKLFGLNLKKGH